MKKLFLVTSVWAALFTISFGQRHSKDSIYIPINLDDCINQLDKIFADSTKTKIKTMTEDQFSTNMHFNFGMWMRNNWGLWQGSRLSQFFNEKGIYHPDDMSGIIMDSYHRYLTGQDIKFQEQIAFYEDYWKKEKQQELERTEKEFSKFQIHDTVLFNYKNGFTSKVQEDLFDSDSCTAKGIITEKDQEKYLIKVRLIAACDEKGIVTYDNKNLLIYNATTKKMEKPKKRVINYMKAGEENWFDYRDWPLD